MHSSVCPSAGRLSTLDVFNMFVSDTVTLRDTVPNCLHFQRSRLVAGQLLHRRETLVVSFSVCAPASTTGVREMLNICSCARARAAVCDPAFSVRAS